MHDDMIADHFTIFAVRKKKRENKAVVTEKVNDYSKFDNSIIYNLYL